MDDMEPMGVEIPFKYTLKFPVTIGKESNEKIFDSLTIERRPQALDFKGFSATAMRADDAIRLLSRICAVPVLVIEKLDAWDFIKLQEVFSDFLPDIG